MERWKKDLSKLKKSFKNGDRQKLSQDRNLFETYQVQLNDFKEKLKVIKNSSDILIEGINQSKIKIHEANEIAYAKISEHFQKLFHELLPSKNARIIKVNNDGPLEDGILFQIQNLIGEGTGLWKNGIDELSGGQKAILSLCYLLAISKFKKTPIYLLDEIDADLDEINCNRVSKLLHNLLEPSQVICISHHPTFCSQTEKEIQLSKTEEKSIVSKIINRKKKS